jgi:hypothetical protein
MTRKTAFCLIEAPDEKSLPKCTIKHMARLPPRYKKWIPASLNLLGRIEDPKKARTPY